MSTTRVPPIVLVVEGVIGAGKSTLIREVLVAELRKTHRVTVVHEPVDEWVASGLLQRFYHDRRRWGYTFQTKAFCDRIQAARRSMTERATQSPDEQAEVILMERSPISDQIFMRTLHQEGSVDDLEYQLYQDWCHLWTQLLPFSVSLYLYVRTGLDESMARLQQRQRDGETGISRDYQARLLHEHDREFAGSTTQTGTRCLMVDGSVDYRTDTVQRKALLERIRQECGW